MHNDHIQGILFTKTDTLDLSHRNMASRMARAVAGKRGQISQKLKARKASHMPKHSGPYLFPASSSTYQRDVASLAARMRLPLDEE